MRLAFRVVSDVAPYRGYVFLDKGKRVFVTKDDAWCFLQNNAIDNVELIEGKYQLTNGKATGTLPIMCAGQAQKLEKFLGIVEVDMVSEELINYVKSRVNPL